MTYEQWCQKFILPIVTQYNDGAITLDEMTNAIYHAITTKLTDDVVMPERE